MGFSALEANWLASEFCAVRSEETAKGEPQKMWMSTFGPARAWQNDLKWTQPWGPAITSKYLQRVPDDYSNGDTELETAARIASPGRRSAIESERRIAQTIESAIKSDLHLIQWIEARNHYYDASSSRGRRRQSLKQMETIALDEKANAEQILPLLKMDSRLGYASDGTGLIRGGLFTPDLVEWKLGELDDVLLRQIPKLSESSENHPDNR